MPKHSYLRPSASNSSTCSRGECRFVGRQASSTLLISATNTRGDEYGFFKGFSCVEERGNFVNSMFPCLRGSTPELVVADTVKGRELLRGEGVRQRSCTTCSRSQVHAR